MVSFSSNEMMNLDIYETNNKFEEAIEHLLTALGDGVFSHPQKKLSQHLRGVFQNSVSMVEHLQVDINLPMLMLTAQLHDIFKADQRFQRYLFKKGERVNHALPSAWFAFLFARQYGFSLRQALFAAEAIRRHHTGLEDFSKIETAWKLDEEKLLSDLKSLERFLSLAYQPNDLKKIRSFFFELKEDSHELMWFELRLLYSILIAADRMDAAGMQYVPSLFPTRTQSFSFRQNDINSWRAQIQQECFENALKQLTQPGIYSLTLPTGAGKTLIGIKIASTLIKQFHYTSLIYALPFISIVEQTTQTATAYFGDDFVQEDHSLRPIESVEDDKNPLKRMADIFRFWHSPVVLTTIAQLWEAIFANRANHVMNFQRLSKAVVILDEPQTLPIKYWDGLGETLQFISQKLGTIFILMTATQPQLFSAREGRKELTPHPYSFPKNRHRYQIIDLAQTFDLEKIVDIMQENHLTGNNSGLVVLNTRKAALQAFDLIKGFLDVRLLSTWLTPRHRKQTLKEVKDAEENHLPLWLVSTQVIEAGVDLDFAYAFRDFAPLDSIIQVGGRCNRHAKRAQDGLIFVAALQINGRKTSAIYDKVLLEATRKILSIHPTFDESAVPSLITQYYQDILGSTARDDLFSNIQQGKWDEYPFLYDKDGAEEVSIIIEEEDAVQPLIDKLQELRPSLENIAIRKALMQSLQQYIIQIPQKYISALQDRCSRIIIDSEDEILGKVLGDSFYFLRQEALGEEDSHTYHPVKGFIPPEETEGEEALIF